MIFLPLQYTKLDQRIQFHIIVPIWLVLLEPFLSFNQTKEIIILRWRRGLVTKEMVIGTQIFKKDHK